MGKHRDYSRLGIPVTKIMGYVEVDRVVAMRRRVKHRCRELDTNLQEVADTLEIHITYIERKLRESMIPGKKVFPLKLFIQLTEVLRMDEVDGWKRPFPMLPPKSERRSLTERIDEETDRFID